MACPGCQSPNVEKLSHYWEALPAESPQRVRYAPPAVRVQVFAVLGIVAVGLWVAVTAAVLWGLGITVAALVWGVFMTMGAAASQARRDEWAATQLCLTCTRRWT